MGEDIVSWIEGLRREETVLVLAHPCSGTRWFTEQVRQIGRACDHEKHPPVGRGKPANVIVTFKKWGPSLKQYDHVVHLVRDPIKVVDSCATITTQRPRLKEAIAAHILASGMRAAVESVVAKTDPIALAAHTLWTLNARSERLASMRFRVEDIVERTSQRRNEHRLSHAIPLTWPRLATMSTTTGGLLDQAKRYGYETP